MPDNFYFLSYISDFLVNYFLDILYLFIMINDYLHFSSYHICGRRTSWDPTVVCL